MSITIFRSSLPAFLLLAVLFSQVAGASEIVSAGVVSNIQSEVEECGVRQSSVEAQINETLRANNIEPTDSSIPPLFSLTVNGALLESGDCFGNARLGVYDRAFNWETSWGERIDVAVVELCSKNFQFFNPAQSGSIQNTFNETLADITRQCVSQLLSE